MSQQKGPARLRSRENLLGGTSSQMGALTRPVVIGQRAYAGEFVRPVAW